MHLAWVALLAVAALVRPTAATNATQRNPTFAFTYTSKTQDWVSEVVSEGFEAAYVYAGDVEFYCEGSPTAAEGGGASPAGLKCSFSGSSPNAFVYYTDFARAATQRFKSAGKQVYINFDGRILPKIASFVPDFSKFSPDVINDFASAVASLVCGDTNVDGMAWDVEPFSNDQVPFFAALDKEITKCGKRWGVFAFGESFSEDMWTAGLGKSGFLFDSTYDLECKSTADLGKGCKPCQCTPPSVYKSTLASHLTAVAASANKYMKPYRLMVSGSGTTQLYTKLTTTYCTGAGGGPAYNASCPFEMSEWMTAALDVFDQVGVRNDPMFEGVGVYGWTTTDGGGFSPVTPPTAALAVMKNRGYLPYAAANGLANNTSAATALLQDKDAQRREGKMNRCKTKDIRSCPPHYMVGSPMNYEV
eukprot:g486.t1